MPAMSLEQWADIQKELSVMAQNLEHVATLMRDAVDRLDEDVTKMQRDVAAMRHRLGR